MFPKLICNGKIISFVNINTYKSCLDPNRYGEEEEEEKKEVDTTSTSLKNNISVYNDKNFVEFWSRYPNKAGKYSAFKAWVKLSPDNGLIERIMQSLDQHIASDQWQRDNGKYIPHPATWLNQKRYDDIIDASLAFPEWGERA